jgi:(p)ppGpp synthase/HD superfamily hydrolase
LRSVILFWEHQPKGGLFVSDLIIRAAQFAAWAHVSQTRKYNNRPYFTHVARVAGMVAGHPLATPELVAAAYLHDVVEDTPTSLTEISARFGNVVSSNVFWLTNPSKGLKENRAACKKMDREHLANAPRTAKIVKLFDRLDNLREMAGHDPEFLMVYLAESKLLLKEALFSVDETLEKELANLIQELSK